MIPSSDERSDTSADEMILSYRTECQKTFQNNKSAWEAAWRRRGLSTLTS